MEYHVASRDELTRRTVDPLGLVYYLDHWNLIAYDHLRDDIRNFRLDQIRTMRVLMEKFERPHGFDLEKHLEERGASPQNIEMKIRFDKRVYQWARSGIPARIDHEEEEEGYVTVTFAFENIDYITSWLLRYGAQAEVVSPTDLRKAMKEKALSIADRY